MKPFYLILSCFCMTLQISCATLYQPDIIAKDGNIYTIGLYTGSSGYSLYQDNFEAKAHKICGKKNYDVLESAPWPSTLEAEQVDDNYTYWVIRCKK